METNLKFENHNISSPYTRTPPPHSSTAPAWGDGPARTDELFGDLAGYYSYASVPAVAQGSGFPGLELAIPKGNTWLRRGQPYASWTVLVYPLDILVDSTLWRAGFVSVNTYFSETPA